MHRACLLSLVSFKVEEAEPAPSPLAGDPWDKGHSTAVPAAAPEGATLLASALPADPMGEAGAARTQAGRARAIAPQEKPVRAGGLAGPCPGPAQGLAYSSPAPTGIAALPAPGSPAMALPGRVSLSGSALGFLLQLPPCTGRAAAHTCQHQARPQRCLPALRMRASQKKWHREARNGWMDGWCPSLSAAPRMSCGRSQPVCGPFLL